MIRRGRGEQKPENGDSKALFRLCAETTEFVTITSGGVMFGNKVIWLSTSLQKTDYVYVSGD
jgi:hypothetical protein